MTDDTPSTSAGTSTPAASKPSTTVTAGTLIMGTYEIEKIINSGGMGEVYRGRNIHNDEPVAIKIVLPSLAHDTKIVALFQKESTVLSRLSHDAIVRYHVFTNDPTIGRPCMVMEFVSGTALADRIEEGPMPLEDVKVMLRRVASGLDKAHKAGVVHRDLSPDNVILEEGSVAHAKLIDFGIAKSTNIGAGTLLQGQFAGKFNWVSPEQLGAFGGHVDGRSDIYSLALITAGASRGKVLPMGASIVDAVGKRSGVPDLEGVDPALVPLLSWMLQPDPALRTESMAKVIAALDDDSLIPQAKAPEPPAPDPNRTVIEPLPIQPPAPVAPAVSEAPLSFNPPPTASIAPSVTERPQTSAPVAQTGSPAWDMPAAREGTSPPDGATVIAPQTFHTAPPPLAEAEPEDASPFGAPGATPRPAAAAAPVYEPIVVPKKGKGGMVAVLALLVVAGGGAGAYYGGLLDSKPVTEAGKTATGTDAVKVPDPAVDANAEADAAKAAEEKAAADQAAAEQAAAEQAAAEKAAADKLAADKAAEEAAAAQAAAEQAAAEKAAADKAAAEALANATAEEKAAALEAAAVAAATEAQSQAEAIAAARSMAEGALAEADKAAADAAVEAMDSAGAQVLADTATAAARKAHTAADAATAGLAVAASAVETAKGAAKPMDGLDALRDNADADAKAAAEAAAAADAAAAKATEIVTAKAAEEAAKVAAAQAEEQAKIDALNADPVARQQAFFASYTPPACTSLVLREPKAEGFAFDGYAVDTKPLEAFSAAWTEATKTTADVTVRLVNDAQCAAMDFVSAHRDAEVLTIRMSGKGDVVKSGEAVEGVIEGLNGRPFTLLYISDAGGATNVTERVEPGEDGTSTFRFSLKLKEGAAPAPQLMMVLIGDEALPNTLQKLKQGVAAKGLFPYLDSQLAASSTPPAIGLSFFRLEN